MKTILRRWWWLLLLILLALLYWQLPIRGTVVVSSLPLDPNAQHPQYIFDPPAPQPGDNVLISITDNVPWTHVKLTVNDTPATFVKTQALPLRNQWNWSWLVTLPNTTQPNTAQTKLAFYRDCDSGCQLRDQRTLEPFSAAGSKQPQPRGNPTKLCVAFPDPARDWHGRSGWIADLTYAQTDERYWQIDALAARVAQSHQAGQRVLVRVDYAPQQGIPPTNDPAARTRYLDHLHNLSRDARLANVYAYIIGTGFNSLDSNQLSLDAPTTPHGYAQLFNGNFGEEDGARSGSNVVQVVRANNPLVRLLIGPVRPWTSHSRDAARSAKAAPWLAYMDTLTAQIDANVTRNLAAGIALTAPDGFALNVPGRVAGTIGKTDISALTDPALEPTRSITSTQTYGAQIGFGLHREWLDIINRYPTTRGKPAYITSTNTFTYQDTATENRATNSEPENESPPTRPAQNYPPGWLTNALTVVNREPQIQSLCWFLDLIPNDQRWRDFSLSQGQGRLKEAAAEFDQLLRDTQ